MDVDMLHIGLYLAVLVPSAIRREDVPQYDPLKIKWKGNIHGKFKRAWYIKLPKEIEETIMTYAVGHWEELDQKNVIFQCQLKCGFPGEAQGQELHCDSWASQKSALLYLTDSDGTIWADCPYTDISQDLTILSRSVG